MQSPDESWHHDAGEIHIDNPQRDLIIIKAKMSGNLKASDAKVISTEPLVVSYSRFSYAS